MHHRYPPPPRPHDIRPPPLPPTVWDTRAERVKQAFLHAYRGYSKFAAGHDELLPLSNGFTDKSVDFNSVCIRSTHASLASTDGVLH